jgi:hypothetical protein
MRKLILQPENRQKICYRIPPILRTLDIAQADVAAATSPSVSCGK